MVFGQAILPARGKHVIVCVDFYCVICSIITTHSQIMLKSKVLSVIDEAIGNGGFTSRYQKPIVISLPKPVKPSVRKNMPVDPIDDDYIEKSNRILKRTSFNKNSKSWGKFLDRVERGQ